MRGRSLLSIFSRLLPSYATPPWLPGSTFISSPSKTRLFASRAKASSDARFWEAHEIETLKKGCEEGFTFTKIAADLLPSRTYKAVTHFARRHQLRKKGSTARGVCKTYEKDVVMRGFAEGLTYREIAEQLPGRSIGTIGNLARRQGASRNVRWDKHESEMIPGNARWGTDEFETITRGIEERLTYAEIAKQLPGRSPNAVSTFASKNGIGVRPLREHEKEMIKKGREEGLTLVKVAKQLGRSVPTVSRFARREGIPPFQRGRPKRTRFQVTLADA